jgi:hypothetical protein
MRRQQPEKPTLVPRRSARIKRTSARTGERVYDKPSRRQMIVVRLAWLRV